MDGELISGTVSSGPRWRRADMHCHSDASNRAGEAALRAIACPECYSDPFDVYAQARRRGMDFVTITDHDSIAGVARIADLSGVLTGEEVTCYFPEDGCKLHVLVYGIDAAHHDALQARARDIYQLAEYIERHQLAHAVAHPIYRQNDKLERHHVERMLLMFKGFECLNGSHSSLHREAFEPMVDRLDREEIARLARRHNMIPRWPEPWVKARLGGSDDHGLLNVGRTWTEFPPDVETVDQALESMRAGRTRVGGESGSSAKLAHAFYSVGVRYYAREVLTEGRAPNLAAMLLQLLVGARPKPTRWELAKLGARHKLRSLRRRLAAPFAPTRSGDGASLLRRLFVDGVKRHAPEHPALVRALDAGLPPLGEHQEIFRFVSSINRDVTEGIAAALRGSMGEASVTQLFDSASAILGQQFLLLPYYFAVFHQNKERHLLRKLTGQVQPRPGSSLRIALFTDTLDEVNGVARFVRDMGAEARRSGRSLTIATCGTGPTDGSNEGLSRVNFAPMLSMPMPYYPGLRLTLPPVLEILEWADREQFDAVHCSTPGPMGMCGWLVSKMLRVPMVGTYHTDFPAYLRDLAGDHRVELATRVFMQWFYGQTARTLTRSRVYVPRLGELGVPAERLSTIVPATNQEKFSPRRRDDAIWARLGVGERLKVLYVGRVSTEKNLRLLADAWRWVSGRVPYAALVVAGDGPFAAEMRKIVAGTPAYFLGQRGDADLGALYASADVFAFPSRTDTLGQVVMEAQCSGLPALVSDEGGPAELVEDEVTGLVLPARDSNAWAEGLTRVLEDAGLRTRLAAGARDRSWRFTLANSFDSFWRAHEQAAGAISDAQVEVSADR